MLMRFGRCRAVHGGLQAHPGAEGWLEEGAAVLAWEEENRVERGVWVVGGELLEVLRVSPVVLTRFTDSRSAPAAAGVLARLARMAACVRGCCACSWPASAAAGVSARLH